MIHRSNHLLAGALACAGSLSLATFSGCSSSQEADAAIVAQYDLLAEAPRQVISEMPVGAFKVSVPIRVASKSVWHRVTFDLAIGVAEADEKQAARFVEQQANRLRDEVVGTLRRAELEELKNPQLGELRGRLVNAINGEAGQPLVQDVYLANFNVEEQ
jgi:flagellar basal body-associated protein FliL